MTPAELVQNNIRLVYKIARQVQKVSGVDFDDLVQYGLSGLETAAANFNASRGFKFSTYAVPTIRGYILNGLNRSGTDAPERRDRKSIAKVTESLANFLGRDPTIAELAEATGLSQERVGAAILGARSTPLREHHQLGPENHGPRLAAELSQHLDDLLRRDLRELEVVRLRYGLDGGDGQTHEAIGQALGLSRPRISQIEASALVTLSRRPEVRQLFAAYVETKQERKPARPTRIPKNDKGRESWRGNE